MKKTIVTVAASLILMPAIVMAGNDHQNKMINFNGPVDLTSVKSLLSDSSMFTEKDVIVEGYLIRQTRKDTYIFSDGEAEIEVELDDDINLAAPITAETKLRIYGEFEGGSTPEIEAEQIQIL
ncbi:YgiW/YdeI family stress tolerance OB fold protein [Vibrio sp. F74]|uniref:YgiW/YdeI family stress tolerance OB fold protein n=1 Tax=Vibrio sp. F74 TaxID=700020 RepID=UPI0035F531B5